MNTSNDKIYNFCKKSNYSTNFLLITLFICIIFLFSPLKMAHSYNRPIQFIFVFLFLAIAGYQFYLTFQVINMRDLTQNNQEISPIKPNIYLSLLLSLVILALAFYLIWP